MKMKGFKWHGTVVSLVSLFFVVVLALAAPFAASAGESPSGSPAGLSWGAGLWVDVAPLVEWTNRPTLSPGDAISPDGLSWFFARPALLTMGFQIQVGPLSAVMALELQQDVGELLMGGAETNLLVTHDWSSFCISNNYPSVGFLEGKGKGWYFSLGRRAINLGPGEYSLTLSGQNPWYDHVLAELSAPLGDGSGTSGSLTYDFLAVNVPNRANDGKYLFMHSVRATFAAWSVGISEYNLVTRTPVDFQDIGPFLVYHHLFASGSNVMAQLDLSIQPDEALRIFAEVLMDDFRLGTEAASSNPNAFGFHAGLEWAILPDEPSGDIAHQRLFRKDYAVRLGQKQLEGRLVSSFEWYWSSTYLFRRNASAPNEAYFTRYFLQSEHFGWASVEPWFAYPLGPDRMIFSGALRYRQGSVASSVRANFVIQGAESEARTYASPYDKNWLGPQGPVTYGGEAQVSVQYAVTPTNLLWLEGALHMDLFGTERSSCFGLTLGFVHRFGLGQLK